VNARTAAVITQTAMVTVPAVALVRAAAGCRRNRTVPAPPFPAGPSGLQGYQPV